MIVCETTERVLESIRKEYGDDYEDEEIIEMVDDFDIVEYINS